MRLTRQSPPAKGARPLQSATATRRASINSADSIGGGNLVGNLPPLPDLSRELRKLLRQIPTGRVTTYGTLAAALGDRLASRWVGHFMLRHEHDTACRCHRVVRVDGSLGGYIVGGWTEKARRLRAEGIRIRDGAVDREIHGFDDFHSARPLLTLREAQRNAAVAVCLQPPAALPRMVAGLDVSYTSAGDGVAGYALVDFESGRLLWHTTARRAVGFPYIQSFLTFRELPLLLAVFEQARAADKLADVLLVDGSGLAHQHHIGLASHLGVTVGMPTIGVTKSLLCGRIEAGSLVGGESRAIVDRGEVTGAAIKSAAPGGQILYVSPGNLVDVPFSVRVVESQLADHRLPEPLYWADHLSRQIARGKSPRLPVRDPPLSRPRKPVRDA